MEPRTIRLKRCLTDKQASALSATFLDDAAWDVLVATDTDGYSMEGELLFRFRKGAVPLEMLRDTYHAFEPAISFNDGRAAASGAVTQRVRNDGSISNMNVGNRVYNGVAGYMDAPPGGRAQNNYCRKTSFTKRNFDQFTTGIPLVQHIDKLYRELCPEHYARQIAIANATNRNYRIGNTSFTTVTINKNFRTAVHKDVGDYKPGFGNLAVYREGTFGGMYFCLPEYRVAIDMQNTDILFVDVHKWHANTPLHEGASADWLRISYVCYYREYMINCKQPAEELQKIKTDRGGFLKL